MQEQDPVKRSIDSSKSKNQDSTPKQKAKDKPNESTEIVSKSQNANTLSQMMNKESGGEPSVFDKDKKEAYQLLKSLNPQANLVGPDGKPIVSGGDMKHLAMMKSQNLTGDPLIDWYNFETRIRKIIYEVVEPLTKKQFQTFDGIDEMKKNVTSVNSKYEDILDRLDRVIKRNEHMDTLEKYCRGIEQEMLTNKALQRNDFVQVMEKVETLNSRIKVAQGDINNFARFDQKIYNLQQQMSDIVEVYKTQVTSRFKEISQEFIKQVQQLDEKYRDMQKDMIEIGVKVDSVREFTKNNDVRFERLNTFINDLRESIEISRFTFTYGKQEQSNIEQKLLLQYQQLEQELQDFKDKTKKENLNIKEALEQGDITEIQKIIFQQQVEMFDRVFNMPQTMKQGSQEFNQTSLMVHNYKRWKHRYIAKHKISEDRLNQELSEYHSKKTSIAQQLNTQSQNDLLKLDANTGDNRMSIQDLLILDQQAMIGGSQTNLNELTERLSLKSGENEGQEVEQQEPLYKLNTFIRELDEDKINEMISLQIEGVHKLIDQQKEKAKKKIEQVNDRINEVLIKLSQEPIYLLLGKLRVDVDSLKTEVIKIKENEVTQGFKMQLQKLEVQQSLYKNDLQQQIYKLKEFDDQLHLKQIEITENLEIELIKMKRERSDQQIQFDKFHKDLRSLRQEDVNMLEMLNTACEFICNMVEIETISVALEQQDEIDKKQGRYFENTHDPTLLHNSNSLGTTPKLQKNNQSQSYLMPTVAPQYNPSQVILYGGYTFNRQNLIHCRRVMLESAWLQYIHKKPYQHLFGSNPQPFQYFYEELVKKVTKISQDFQSKIDMINEELSKQNRPLPTEIIKIKENIEISDQKVKQKGRNNRKIDLTQTQRDFMNQSLDSYSNNDLLDYGVQNPNNFTKALDQKSRLAMGQKSPTSHMIKPALNKERSREKLSMPDINIRRSKGNLNASSIMEFGNASTTSPFNNPTIINPQIDSQQLVRMRMELNILPKGKLPMKQSILLQKNNSINNNIRSKSMNKNGGRIIGLNDSLDNQQQYGTRNIDSENTLILMPIKSQQQKYNASKALMNKNEDHQINQNPLLQAKKSMGMSPQKKY